MADELVGARQGPHLGHKIGRKATQILRNTSSMIAPGEQVWALFAVNSMRPQADFLVVTNCRIATGDSSTLRRRGVFKGVVFADQLAGVDIDKRGRIAAADVDGAPVTLAPLLDDKDRSSLLHYVQSLRSNQPPAALLDLAKGIQDGAFVPPASGVVYLGSAKGDDLPAAVSGIQACLVPAEELRAVFPIKGGPSSARFLAFTSGRVLGLSNVEDEHLPRPLWSINNTDLTGLTANRHHGSLTAAVVTDGQPRNIALGRLRDMDDCRALDYFGQNAPAPNDVLQKGMSVAPLASPGPPQRTAPPRPVPPDKTALPPTAQSNTGAGAPSAATRALTEAEAAAVQNGLPMKNVDLAAPILEVFAEAVEASERGDINREEMRFQGASTIVKRAGITTRYKVRAWANREMARLVARGQLRRGAENIANIGDSLQVFSDRLLHGNRCYVLDRDVQASVELDGQILETSRPTFTRMAIGSVLPGTALIVGFAAPKRSTKDNRKANFIVVHPKWRIVEPIDPDKAAETRGIAAQINAIASSQTRTTAAPATPAVEPRRRTEPAENAEDGVADQLAQLERVEALLDSGALTPEQADQMRSRILG